MKMFLRALLILLPWPLRRPLLVWLFGYRLDPTSRIGLAWVFPRELIMDEGAYIGHLTVGINLDLIHLRAHARIGKGNWITGFPSGPSPHFAHQPERHSELIVGEHSAITNRHLIDCTGGVTIGKFTTFAGFQSQILSHSIDLETNRQSSAPIKIGDYCFLGTNCVLLSGSALPSYSVLGAKSLLNKPFTDQYWLYGGSPARPLRQFTADEAYFHRAMGYVV